MSSQDPFNQRFRGPTPPPALDRAVLSAADAKAAELAGSRLSNKAAMSYSSQPGSANQQAENRRESVMSDAIVFPCPACGTKYSVSPSHAGKKTSCKKCGASVTVPSPQVANPTIVGGTRTIRRADIDPGSSTREEATGVSQHESSVDMTGGASVMRKDETVIGAPPMTASDTSARGRGPTRAPTRTGHVSQPAPMGRAMPPHMHGAPKKKNNLPLFAGIGGGAVAVILVVVIIIASSGGSGTGGGGTGGDVGAASSDTGGPAADPDKSLLVHHQKNINNVMTLTLDQVRTFYEEAKARKEKPEWRTQQDAWANQLLSKAESDKALPMAQVALMLDNDGYSFANNLLRKAATAMQREGIAVKRQKDGQRQIVVPNKTFEDVVKRLGWVAYSRPAKMDDYLLHETEGSEEYNKYYVALDPVYADVKLFPPDVVAELKKLEKLAIEKGDEFFAGHEKDGFARNARRAWIRFKQANDTKGSTTLKWNRAKQQRSFCQLAMRRDNEAFDKVWTYTYWKPFMVYVEKPPGTEGISADFEESLASKSALLQHLYDWFSVNFVTRYSLQRVKPMGQGETAEKEGWPLSVIVLKDSQTFEQYCEDEIGQPMPGARAFYSPRNEIVITYDDRNDANPDTAWFNESVLIHETFHLLSDHYGANPIDWKRLGKGEGPDRPSYSSILVQEGITDSVSGFVRSGGKGRDAKYEFLQLNHLRLQSWQRNYESMSNRNIFRLQDLLKCGSYSALVYLGCDRLRELGIPVPPGAEGRFQGPLMGLYYATACQMSYFFQYYKEGSKYPYRDAWWEFLGKDYKGEIKLTSYDTTPGVNAFKQVFGIKTDADWDAINKKFEDYTKNLKSENVGKGADEGELPKTVLPSEVLPGNRHPGAGNARGTEQNANRREEEIPAGR